MRRLLFILPVLLLTAAGWFFLPYTLRVEHIAADPGAGFYADYYRYTSPGARQLAAAGTPAPMLVQPNNSGTNSDDPAVHRRDAWWTGLERQRIADRLNAVLLVPAFIRPGEDWPIYTHALDRDVFTTTRPELRRPDLQLLAMIDHARAGLAVKNIPTHPRILLQGFSASAMFANRFAALHPDRVLAVAAGSPGGWPIAPVADWQGEPLPYPAGVADLAELTGVPFDSAGYAGLPQLHYLGALDDNDSVDFRDGWDEPAAAQLDRLFGDTPLARWKPARTIHLSHAPNARFVLVPDVGHDRKALQHLAVAFFEELLSRSPTPP